MYVQVGDNAVVSLTDEAGSLLLTKTILGSGSINVSGLTAGMYYLHNNRTGETKKIVIIK